MSEYRLMKIGDLDDVSYDEIDKLFAKAEDTRAIVEYRLKKIGDLKDAATYKKYDEFMAELPQSKEIRRRRSAAEKIREANNVETTFGGKDHDKE